MTGDYSTVGFEWLFNVKSIKSITGLFTQLAWDLRGDVSDGRFSDHLQYSVIVSIGRLYTHYSGLKYLPTDGFEEPSLSIFLLLRFSNSECWIGLAALSANVVSFWWASKGESFKYDSGQLPWKSGEPTKDKIAVIVKDSVFETADRTDNRCFFCQDVNLTGKIGS